MCIRDRINRLEKAQELNTERLSAIGRDRERLTSEISELGSKLESEQQNAESLGDSRREGEARLAELNAAEDTTIHEIKETRKHENKDPSE